MKVISLTKNFSYIPATEEPFTADVVFIRTKDCTWIYDAGTTVEISDYINSIQGQKNLVLSHFHSDHTANIPRIKCDQIYCGKETFKHINQGNIVLEEMNFDDGIKIGLIPNSHAKGSIYLECGDYIFLGDATYSAFKNEGRSYNSQLLLEEIKFLEKRQVQFCCLSHDPVFAIPRTKVISKLKKVYGLRTDNNPEIKILF